MSTPPLPSERKPGPRPGSPSRGRGSRAAAPTPLQGETTAETAAATQAGAAARASARRRVEGSGRRRGPASGDPPAPRRPWAPVLRMRRFGNLAVLLPPSRPPAESLAGCLDKLRQDWAREGHEAALWQAWPSLAGPQLAPHCRPLQLHGGVLCVGAPPGPWLQALQYNRHQLLGSLRAAGFRIRELRFQQHHPGPTAAASSADTAATWACHPSRIDVHGLADCPACQRPAPAGEMARWGHCGFCRRAALAAQGPPPAAEPPPAERPVRAPGRLAGDWATPASMRLGI